MITGWRYYWRRYLGWLPLQWCMVCGDPYWGGFPRWSIERGRIRFQWQACWADYCSHKCCDEDLDRLG